MTSPSRLSIRAILIVLVILSIAVAIIIIVTLTASSEPPKIGDGGEPSTLAQQEHMHCSNIVTVGKANEHWLNFHHKEPEWKGFPAVPNTDYVLISRKYGLKSPSPGIQFSVYLPHNNSVFYVMAVKHQSQHTTPITMTTNKGACLSTVIDDPEFFKNETHFRVFIFYKHHITLEGARFAITALPQKTRVRDMHYRSKTTTEPKFSKIEMGVRDTCSVEIVQSSKVDCNWWNVEDGDNADFKKMDRHECIRSGVASSDSATWFFGVTADDPKVESRALMVSPIIERNSSSVFMTLWYMFKCDGPRLRVHLVPANQPLRRVVGVSNIVAEVTQPANHSAWKFLSFHIRLPETHDAYHIVLEGIVPPDGNCTDYSCYFENSLAFVEARDPILGLDDISIELMHEECKTTADKPNVMDCKFQENDTATTCEWSSSVPNIVGMEGLNYFDDWKAVNSGDGEDHGATEQHFEGRGYIMSFDATGRATAQSYVRSPLLKANSDCACVMTFLYLLRGHYAPRLQVNMVYGVTEDSERLEPQWSLFGNQSEDWETATIVINLRQGKPFKLEIRVRDVTNSISDVHFDDMAFIGCDMDKYEE